MIAEATIYGLKTSSSRLIEKKKPVAPEKEAPKVVNLSRSSNDGIIRWLVINTSHFITA